jgi:hypothetical protein
MSRLIWRGGESEPCVMKLLCVWKRSLCFDVENEHSFVVHLIFVLLSINVTFTFYYLLFFDMFRPHTAIFKYYSILSRSWCSVMPIFCLCQGASHVLAMRSCWWCAYCQCPCVRIFVLALWPPCCLFTNNKQHGGHKENTNILTHGHWQ